MKKLKDLKILFLAHYAPRNPNDVIPTGIADTVYAIYHHKIYREILNIFPNTISSSDVSILMKPNLNVDYIFSLYNRLPFNNSEIFVSSVAEYLKIPYLGATPNIRALAEDKHLAKMVASHLNIPTPEWRIYNVGDVLLKPDFDPPYFIKPRFGAASKYISEESSCESWEQANKRITNLHDNNIDVILEKQIIGVYHTSPVLHNFNNPLFLPCISQYSTHKGGIVTYEQKRKIEPGLTRTLLSDIELTKKIHTYSKALFSIIQPLDYTRFDYIVDNLGVPYFLEFNVCCNLGEHSTISQAAKAKNITYTQLIENIIFSSLYRNNLISDTFGKDF